MNRKALIKRLLVLRSAAKRSSRSRYLHIRHRSEGRLATVEYLLRYMEARSNRKETSSCSTKSSG